MSSKKHQIPAIRFKGFTDAWEQRKLIEEADFFDEKRIPIDSEKRVQGRYPYYGATGVIDYVDNYIFDGEYILLAEDGANIITRNSPVAYITEGKFWLNNHAHIMKMKLGSNLFLLQLLERQNYEKFNSGTAQPKLNGQIVKNMIFNFPSYKEQNKIGNFFKLIDEAIALHQRQMDNYKELKKTSMQKIFNQELRFKDKNGNDYPVWQKKKLKDLGKFYSGTGFNDKYQGYLDLSIPFFKVSDMNIASNSKYMVESNNTVDDDICREMKINKITGPAILFAKVGAAIYMERKRIVHNDFLMDNNMMALRINDSVDIEFTYYLCQSLSFSKYAQVGALPSYNASDIGRLHCKLPVISEQKKIAIFLSTLDQKVNEAAQKVELFKELKEGLMQQMFF